MYAVGHTNLSLEARFLAARKVCGPHAVLSHVSAAALWGVVERDHGLPEVTVHGEGTRGHGGIRVHRTASLETSDRGCTSRSPSRRRPAPCWPARRC